MTALLALQEIPEQLPEVDLPGGVAPFLRAFFSVSQGIQMAGGIVGGLVAIALLVWAVRRRLEILAWFRTLPRPWQVGFVSLALAVLVVVSAASRVSWNYMQHDNDFCTGCHVMGDAYLRFTQSGHADLSCHDCHRQSIFASMRQLHLWVRDRPEEIGEHSPVPSEICAQCHIADDPADNWAQIAATAGHVAHLQSDSSALADVQCVTCHGQEVHQFRPADATCAQSGCHAQEETRIVLGAMTEETGFHCLTCHEFTADRVVPTAIDSAAGMLSPGLAQCTSCHEMADLWAGYDPLLDPHDARCGACHNPHEQDRPEVALVSCTAGGCHARPDTLSTFHIGLSPEVTENCTGCHQPHIWTRDGDDCAACHADIPGRTATRGGGGRVGAAALGPTGPTFRHLAVARSEPRTASSTPTRMTERADARGPWAEGHPLPPSAEAPVRLQQAFRHADHPTVECTACHSNRNRHGEVTVRTQSDCFSCHHSTRTAAAQGCGDCHTPSQLGRVRQVSSTLRMSVGASQRLRALPFDHDEHADLRCVDCHGGGIRQTVQAACSACHEDHHRQSATSACADCHEEHRADAHTAAVHTDGCTGSGCHTERRFDRMARTRQFCTSCHQDMIRHEPAEPCTNCHLVPEPGGGGRR